ncbi:TPA_asm: coat protein [ssRNA phage SRR6960799_30]|uniref:Coat protein n=1 Tax=ssRNA phage SRR6960799_30 TaxID=2786588 RepID=A0A8S5L0R0_9VIRU|nr:coat protein [ssRNA phage SRR6960799_30]DAD50706.1 TPA_asm: coat protein [ssRNA phage SRR6960799_30]
MPTITTTLVDYSQVGNTKTLTAPGHTVSAPRLVIQKRKIPSTSSGVAESDVKVVYGTTDTNGPLSSRVSVEAVVRYPANGNMADVTAALTLFREVVASDEFQSAVYTQNWIK